MPSKDSILFVDAYDSFAENIAALLAEQLYVQVTLIRIDCDIQTRSNQSKEEFYSSFDAIVLGPGPGNPQNQLDVGLFSEIWDVAAKEQIPVLGICLGFQSLCVHNGIPIARLSLPCHGHAKVISHASKDIFRDAGNIVATCYNSLGVRVHGLKVDAPLSRPSSSGSNVSELSSQSTQSTASASSKPLDQLSRSQRSNKLEVLAWDKDGWTMAVRHKHLPFHGFQFHPESCKSNLACYTLIQNWWAAATTHNKAHRTYRRVRSADFRTFEQAVLSDEAQKLLEFLQYYSRTCKGTINRKRLHLPGCSSMIADLCNQASPDNMVAMLESTKRGRYSIYAFPHKESFLLEFMHGQAVGYVLRARASRRFPIERGNVLATLECFIRSKSFVDDKGNLPFQGGFIGFVSYEFGTASLQLDVRERDRPLPSTPEMGWLWVDRSVVYDHETGTVYVQSIQDGDPWVDEMVTTLQTTYDASRDMSTPNDSDGLQGILASTKVTLPNRANYISHIRHCKAQLLAGNSYELCLTTEATITTSCDRSAPYILYRNIQKHNGVPYASYLSLHGTKILSSSPEHYLSWSYRAGTIDMIPMKGTVKKTPNMTLATATEILSSPKESAENLMIADLIRHDLYSTVGHNAKVEVVKLCDVVESETVFSLVSHIRAHAPLSADAGKSSIARVQEMSAHGFRALMRTLPPGSMTGAPKKRSCEILHGLEQRDRGVYSGAIGYMDVCGNGAWSVCIRSAFSNDQDSSIDEETGEERRKWRIGAGGAITVLSDEEAEWDEMKTKLESVLRGFRRD